MSLTRSNVLGYLLPILAIMVLAILLTVTLFRLADIQRAMRNNVNANMVWVIYQTHVESLMLANAVQQQLVDPGSDSDLLHRYQMLLSRISVLNDGPQKRALQAMGIAETLTIQANAVLKLAQLFEGDTIDATGYAQIRQTLGIFSATLQSASGKAMMAQWEEAGERIDTYRNAVLTVFFLMIGIWICGAVLSVQLLLALKKTRDNERIRRRGIELQKQLENERKISDLYRSFGSMVSHQFRTPLAIIDATMQRLMRAGDRMAMEEIRHRAAKARQATQRLNQLIENILQADRFMEQLDVAMRPCRLADVARQAVAEQQAITPRRAIHVVDDTGGESTVLCDPMLTSQIIGNLLSNAIKYSEEETAVSMRIYRNEGLVCCQVSDQGRGISAHDLTHVFKRYFRARAATDIVGTGIGLHIAQELAALQNGNIEARSEPGVGSSFTLKLLCLRHMQRSSGNATQAAATANRSPA